ncbi:hypothetical protein LG200_04920 [Methylobacillus caricis]|uniref:hypothetical protein n=1 Tax=Methylobacillus caricis TaxID=1971611 RepID=UPI001CFF7783|nr:hypothetical protein [Methylobacillus caricis]MCB5187345.1 hypothetical protein [Methylobacillus caricis]
MRSQIIMSFVLASVSITAWATKPALELAKETFAFVEEHESMLTQLVSYGSQEEFIQAVYKPTIQKITEWPRFGKNGYEKYTDCRMVLDSFKQYSSAQFKAKGKLPDSDAISKLYFSDKRACRGLLIELGK